MRKSDSTISPSEYLKIDKEIKKENWRRYRKDFLYPNILYFLLMILTSAIIITIVYGTPLLTRWLVNASSSSTISDSDYKKVFIIVIASLSGFWVARLISSWSFTVFKTYEFKVYVSIQKRTWAKIMKLEISEFDKHDIGYYISRIKNDPKYIAEFSNNGTRILLEVFLSLVTASVIIFTIDWVAGIVAFILITSTLYVSIRNKVSFSDRTAKIRKAEDVFGARISNDIHGILEIKNYVAFDKVYDSTNKAITDINKQKKRESWLYSKWISTNYFLFSSFSVAFALVGVLRNLDIGTFTALIMYATVVIRPINLITYIAEASFRGGVSLNRYYRFMDKVIENNTLPSIGIVKGEIRLENANLYFDKTHALRNISLTIKPGEKIGIVGETGAGKSTLVRVLMGYYKLNSGDYYLDNKKVYDHSINSIRGNISYISQDPFISFTTIEQNIKFGLQEINESKYWEAINLADVNNIIDHLPNKDKERVGPRGITLSGGEKQRIAISRMFLRDNNIVILDEATSSLDNHTERKIQSNIDEFTKDKTVITIAHRLTTLNNVDRIIVMENGEIIEQGTQEELLAQKGSFYKYKISREKLESKEVNNE